MSIAHDSARLAFKEFTYKLKKSSIVPTKDSDAKLEISIKGAKIEQVEKDHMLAIRIDTFLDTEDFYFQGECVFIAKLLGTPESALEDLDKYLTDNQNDIFSKALPTVRNSFNKSLASILSMTVTSPAKDLEFWPEDNKGASTTNKN